MKGRHKASIHPPDAGGTRPSAPRRQIELRFCAVQGLGLRSLPPGQRPRHLPCPLRTPPDFSLAFVTSTTTCLQALRRTVRRQLERWGWHARICRYLFHHLPPLTPATALAWEKTLGCLVSFLVAPLDDDQKCMDRLKQREWMKVPSSHSIPGSPQLRTIWATAARVASAPKPQASSAK